MIEHAYVAFGSNEGDRVKHLGAVLREFGDRGIHLKRMAPYRLSRPAEGVEGGLFLNTVFECGINQHIDKFFLSLQRIEIALGSKVKKKGKSRPVDLDLLLWEDVVVEVPGLIVPHPRITQRDFVLQPLCDLIPDEYLPGSSLTFREYLRRCPSVTIISADPAENE